MLKVNAISDGNEWPDNDAVFTNEKVGWLEGSAVYRSLMRHLERIGIDNVRMHDLRHTFATVSIAEGVDIKTLQETLGYYDPGFTLKQYGHSIDTMKKSAAQKLSDFAERINTQKTD